MIDPNKTIGDGFKFEIRPFLNGSDDADIIRGWSAPRECGPLSLEWGEHEAGLFACNENGQNVAFGVVRRFPDGWRICEIIANPSLPGAECRSGLKALLRAGFDHAAAQGGEITAHVPSNVWDSILVGQIVVEAAEILSLHYGQEKDAALGVECWSDLSEAEIHELRGRCALVLCDAFRKPSK